METDHKLLEALSQKNVMDILKRLQRMLLRLQRYHLQITYKRGSEMYLADTLSQAYIPETGDPLRQSQFCQHLEQVNAMEDWSVNDVKLTAFNKQPPRIESI